MGFPEVKRSNMHKSAIKHVIYGGLSELVNDKKFYYVSSLGAGYSHFTDDGKLAVAELIELVAYEIVQADTADLYDRAKQQVLAALKGQE